MKEDIDKLINDLKSKDGIKRQNARVELVKIGDPAIDYLVELLDSKKHRTQWEALKAIGEIGSPNSIDVLIEFLDDDELDIRWLAAEGLINIGNPSIKPLVTSLLKNYRSVYLREATHHVLKDLKAKKEYIDNNRVIPALESYNKLKILQAAENLLDAD